MSSFKQQNSKEGGQPACGRGFDLWYYQERGDGRTYFRLAPLGLALLVVSLILSLIALTAFFFYRSRMPIKDPDITITPPPATTGTPPKSVIKPVTPSVTPPPVYRPPNMNMNTPAASPTAPARGVYDRPQPKATPQTPPSSTPPP